MSAYTSTYTQTLPDILVTVTNLPAQNILEGYSAPFVVYDPQTKKFSKATKLKVAEILIPSLNTEIIFNVVSGEWAHATITHGAKGDQVTGWFRPAASDSRVVVWSPQ
jgi:hypothetical protein